MPPAPIPPPAPHKEAEKRKFINELSIFANSKETQNILDTNSNRTIWMWKNSLASFFSLIWLTLRKENVEEEDAASSEHDVEEEESLIELDEYMVERMANEFGTTASA